jgi:L-lactate dehydrogenase
MGEHGVRDVALSVPSVIGAAGVQMRIREKWEPDEYRRFFDAVENVRNVLQQL